MSKYLPTDNCAICGDEIPKRHMNKIMISFGHVSVVSPKLMCHVCDNCLPDLFDWLAIKEPERKVNWGVGCDTRICNECGKCVGKVANYCSNCGARL